MRQLRKLLSLPDGMAKVFGDVHPRLAEHWFAAGDPPGKKLGSGGGVAQLLFEAWRASGSSDSLSDWLGKAHHLVVLSGGMSRRLPSYAVEGKSLMPLPVFRWSVGQRPDQTLLDFVTPPLVRALEDVDEPRIVIVAGDVVMRFRHPFSFDDRADVSALGIWAPADMVEHFGVFVTEKSPTSRLIQFLQKPSASVVRSLPADQAFLLDIGIWALGPRATDMLLERSGWDESTGSFKDGSPSVFGLYEQFGPALGSKPTVIDDQLSTLKAKVQAVEAEFYHLGMSRQLIEAVSGLQNAELDPRRIGALTSAYRHPDQHVQNVVFDEKPAFRRDQKLWIENSRIPSGWTFEGDHVVTGTPENDWSLTLADGVCLDFAPVGEHEWCIRFYGIDDRFSGAAGATATTLFGEAFEFWLRKRNLVLSDLEISDEIDIQRAPIYPVVDDLGAAESFVQWLVSPNPQASPEHEVRYRQSRKLSAEDLGSQANIARIIDQRRSFMLGGLAQMATNHRHSVFYKMDLSAVADLLAGTPDFEAPSGIGEDEEPVKRIHSEMLVAAVERRRGKAGWEQHEREAFLALRDLVLDDDELRSAQPQCDVLEDQIVWSRSPIRLDLAGGWTDTPPYCILHGGKVLNLAFDLNGQPPIQVFAKRCERNEIVVRSIDLGVESTVQSYAQLTDYAEPGSGFALAKAALALAGFEPRFHAAGGFGSLEEQLKAFGSGIELSLLAAVPKGSGLGTSSILAATTLGALGELCGLGWSKEDIIRRTLALEQLLTTGGGWQDQAGGILRGVKTVESEPGIRQDLTYRWLPDHLFTHPDSRASILLYYTGITRLAKNLLQEIVRGMFLNSGEHLRTIEEIGDNVIPTRDSIERSDYDAFCRNIRRSWELNQQLDSGTNTPEVQAILDRIGDWIGGLKLLGAGGGGYLLLLAKDPEAAKKIKLELESTPPNPRARFVTWQLSDTGLQTTRS